MSPYKDEDEGWGYINFNYLVRLLSMDSQERAFCSYYVLEEHHRRRD